MKNKTKNKDMWEAKKRFLCKLGGYVTIDICLQCKEKCDKAGNKEIKITDDD